MTSYVHICIIQVLYHGAHSNMLKAFFLVKKMGAFMAILYLQAGRRSDISSGHSYQTV